MNSLGTIIGEICKIVFPISEDIVFGNQKSSVAICTLGSISLLESIRKSALMEKISLVGRLLSENNGIDSLVKNTISNNQIKTIIVCGNDVWGHKSGHSLLSLHKNGIDDTGRIIGSKSPNPFLTVKKEQVEKFRTQVQIINKIGETDIESIGKIINSKT